MIVGAVQKNLDQNNGAETDQELIPDPRALSPTQILADLLGTVANAVPSASPRRTAPNSKATRGGPATPSGSELEKNRRGVQCFIVYV